MSTETNTKKNEWREREVGALWMKQGTTQDFMSGHCSVNDEKVELVVFKNKNKTSDRAPDYILYKNRRLDEQGTSQKSATQSNGGATSSDPEEVPELLA
mgnify:CR=1 FL=1|jgi:hypothetical protein|tara:strand:- start:24 stop:320 length:297 start_codon:yes stop_codon:yes gene_type:complete